MPHLDARLPGDAAASASASASASAASASASISSTIPATQVCLLALAAYVGLRLTVGSEDFLWVGLAAVPLFIAAAFLDRRWVILADITVVVATIVPLLLHPSPWDSVDTAAMLQLVILVVATSVIRRVMVRATRSTIARAASEALVRDRLQTVLGIAERLTTTHERDAIFPAIVAEVNRALQVDGTTIQLFSEGRSRVVARTQPAGAVAGAGDSTEEGSFPSSWVFGLRQTRRPILRDGMWADQFARRPDLSAVAGHIADLVVPLILEDRVIGALGSFTESPRTWTPADVEFMLAVANHAAIAIHNADIIATTRAWAARLGAIQAASARLSRQNTVESVGRTLVEEIGHVIHYHNCRVYLLVEPDRLEPIAFEGRVGEYEKVDFALLRTKVGLGFTGWVAAHNAPLLIDDTSKDPRGLTIPGTDEVDESMVCVPLAYDGKVTGVITLSKLGLHQFDDDDLRLLTILADQAATALESAQLLSHGVRLASELRQLLDMSGSLAQSLDPRQVAALIGSHLVSAFGVDECELSWWDQPGDRLFTIGYWPSSRLDEVTTAFELAGYPETSRVLRDQVSVIVDIDDPAAHPAEVEFVRSRGNVLSVMIPLVAKGRSIALVELMSRSRVTFDQPALELARTMANEAAMALENARHYQDAREQADHDQLTGLLNHRGLHQRLGEEILRAQRAQATFSVMMIDLNDFKVINDTFGHLVGDQVLAWVADQIRIVLRASDLATRFGGDEFAVILPDTRLPGARQVARRLLHALRDVGFAGDGRRPISVGASIGVAEYPASGRTAAELLDAADAEMYRKKAAQPGRARGRGALQVEPGSAVGAGVTGAALAEPAAMSAARARRSRSSRNKAVGSVGSLPNRGIA